MLPKSLIAIALVSVTCLFSQRSLAQVNFQCTYDSPYNYQVCGGGIGCSGSQGVVQYDDIGDGFYYPQQNQSCLPDLVAMSRPGFRTIVFGARPRS